MKKKDARVQTFSDTVNVLRMVKLFGWEGKMCRLISEKREEELGFVKKSMGLDLGMDLVKRVICLPSLSSLAMLTR
jgi:hypothetical protein